MSVIKDDENELPIPHVWRNVFCQIVKSLSNKDYLVNSSISNVLSLSIIDSKHIEDFIKSYGEELTELPQIVSGIDSECSSRVMELFRKLTPTIIQVSSLEAAEMIKLAMIAIQNEMIQRGMKTKLILQIHDELLFEFPNDEEEILVKLVVDKMENAMELSVPIVVDYGIGETWYDAH